MEPSLIYLIILVGVSVVLLSIGIVVTYLRILNKYFLVKEEKAEIKSSLAKEKDKILEEAAYKGSQIIEEARLKAQEIVKEAQIFGTDQQDRFGKEIEKASETQVKQFQEVLKTAQNQSITEVQSISKGLKEEALKEIEAFRHSLESEVIKGQGEARVLIENTYKTLEAEVGKHKEMRLKEVDETIFDIVKEVSRKVLAKEIGIEEHEKLVMKALEEAKRQGIF